MTPLELSLTASKKMLGLGSADSALTFPHEAQELKTTALSHANFSSAKMATETSL